MAVAKGSVVHGEFTSSDASALSEANSRLLLYGAGSTTALTLLSTDQVVITDIFLFTASALTVTLYDGADTTAGAGEVILRGNFGANSGASLRLTTPHWCQAGTWPKLKASGAGQVDAQIWAVIASTGYGS